MQIVLASKSPARKRLLETMGIKFSVLNTETNERGFKSKFPSALVKKITLGKAREAAKIILNQHLKEPIIVITADSIVYHPKLKKKGKFLRHFPNGPIIGKANNKAQVVSILNRLSRTTHYLYTGLCVAKISLSDTELKNYTLTYSKAKITFRKLEREEILAFAKREEALQYAGCYTIERHSNSSSFVKSYTGDLDTIIGLPIHQLKTILKDLKILN